MNRTLIDNILARHGWKKARIIAILQDIQEELNYLPQKELSCIAEKLELPLSQIYALVTFYRAFNLEPRGEHLITVCLGTACHVRGAMMLVENLQRMLKINPGETTKDRRFTLETVNCLGCCAIGPVVVIDGKHYGEMTTTRLNTLLEKYHD